MPQLAHQVNSLSTNNPVKEQTSMDRLQIEELEKLRSPLFYHATSYRASSAKIVFKILAGLKSLPGGWCKISQEAIGLRMIQFGYTKNLAVRQVRKVIKLIEGAGLITYKRKSHNRSIYEYNITDIGWKAYQYFIKSDPIKMPTKLSTESVDRKNAAKKVPVTIQKSAGHNYSQVSVLSEHSEKKCRYISYTNNYTGNSSFNSKNHTGGDNVSYQTKTDYTGGKSIINETPKAELTRSQKEIVQELCKASGMDSTQTLIVLEDVAEEMFKIVKGGAYTTNFEGFAKNVMMHTADIHYWTLNAPELSRIA